MRSLNSFVQVWKNSYLNSFSYDECDCEFFESEYSWLEYLKQNNLLNTYCGKYSKNNKYEYFWIGYEGQDVLSVEDFPNNIYFSFKSFNGLLDYEPTR
ncbi:5785_t:CDS:1, partial [Gigaspora margarita]